MLNAARNKPKGQHVLPKEDEYFYAVREIPVFRGNPKGGTNYNSLLSKSLNVN